MSCISRIAAIATFALLSQAALAASDACNAAPREMGAFIGERIIHQLDLGRSASGAYPQWMEQILGAPDVQAERLARYCDAHPDETLSAALEQMFTPESAER